MFTSILAATDRVTGRDPVVISAARMASALGASWSIVHVLASASLDNHERVLHFCTGQTVDATARYRSEIGRQLRHAYSDLFAWSTPSEIRIATGIPWKEIDRQASLLAADLIIMGPHAGDRDKDNLLRVRGRIGSTVKGVITRQRCPVLMINQHPCRPKPAFKRLLVGLDFSASCESALGFAGDLARFYQAHIDLFHMLPIPPYPKYTRDDYDADRDSALDKMALFSQPHLGGVSHSFHCWGGAIPYQELCKCAANCHTDAIVIGSHTKENQGKWYAGSTVEKMGLRTTSPIFVLTHSSTLPRWGKSRPLTQQPVSARDHTIHVFGKNLADSVP